MRCTELDLKRESGLKTSREVISMSRAWIRGDWRLGGDDLGPNVGNVGSASCDVEGNGEGSMSSL